MIKLKIFLFSYFLIGGFLGMYVRSKPFADNKLAILTFIFWPIVLIGILLGKIYIKKKFKQLEKLRKRNEFILEDFKNE